MTGAIIYFKEAVKGNENYIKWYIEKFTKKGVDFKLIYVEDIDYNNLPDFAVCRFIAPEVTKKLEEKGVKCFNNSFVSEICNDKLKTYEYVSEKGIEIMPVLDKNCNEFPVVVKSKNGHGGTEVFMVENHRELVEKLDILKDNYVIQKPCNNLGRDVRVYVIGGKIITAMLRISDKDFRSNFCLGGRAEVYNLSDEEREKMTQLLNHGFIDTYRYLYPLQEGVYSWWSYRFKAREKNAGWRIDYFIVSDSLKDKIIDATIETEIMGSDHCPVTLTIDL